MSKVSFLSFPFGVAMCSLFASTVSAATPTLTVGTCLGASPYTTISAAVAAAASGATVQVCPGTYPEQVTITKSLNLIGLLSGTADNPVIQSPAGGVVTNSLKIRTSDPQAVQVLIVKAANVNISNITVDGSNNGITGCAPDLVGIKYALSSGTVNHVAVKNQALSASLNGCQSGEGIIAETASSVSGSSVVTVSNSSVHGYQKNGIVGDGPNTKLTVTLNFVSGQGPTTGAAENGIEFINGVSGTIVGNIVLDHVFSPATATASGILIYSAQSITVSGNSIGNSQNPIVTVTDASLPNPGNPKGLADKTIITANVITNTASDGIDACSNSNTITNNLITNTGNSGIHLDSTCTGTGEKNTVIGNTVNESCAGVLQGATPNTISGNTTFNVQSTVLAGDTCTPLRAGLLAIVGGSQSAAHVAPAPY